MWIAYVIFLEKKYPWSMLHDYPRDIQEASTLPAPDEHTLKTSKTVSGLLGLLIMVAAAVMTCICTGDASWPACFISAFIIVFIWNVTDLLVMDWLIFCTITPKWMVIEGTTGCKGYKDYFFHFKGFLIGCVYSLIMALIFGTVAYLF